MAGLETGRLQRLDGFLRSVTPALAAKLARAIEFDRLRGGALPHEAILEALRPKLREAERRLSRLPTPRRLFSTAFEDLILPMPRFAKQRGRIARSSIEPVWNWLTGSLLPDEAGAAIEAIRAKLISGAAEFVDGEVQALQTLAAQAILAAIPSPEKADPSAVRSLGGQDIAADAYDMARMMEIAPLIARLQHELPRPIHALEERDITTIRAVWEQVVAEHPDCAPYIAFFVLGRLDKPWEIMRLAGALSRKMDDILLSRTDIGFVGELLLSDLEDCVAHLAAIRPNEMKAAPAVDVVTRFGRLSTGIVRELGIKRDGVWGKRLMAARAGIADEMERLLARATKDISATLPMTRRAGLNLRARRIPDLTRMLDPQKADRAIQLAALVMGARPHATAGAFGSIIAEIDEKIGGLLRHYTADMIDELAIAPPGLRPQASVFIQHAIELTCIMMSPEEGELIRRRAAAALDAQAAEPMVA